MIDENLTVGVHNIWHLTAHTLSLPPLFPSSFSSYPFSLTLNIRVIEAKLEDELSLRNEATAASQALDDLKQECSQYDNQARGLETEIKQAETQLRCYFMPLSFIAQYVCCHSSICCTVPCYFLLLSL